MLAILAKTLIHFPFLFPLIQDFQIQDSTAPVGATLPGTTSVNLANGIYSLKFRNPQGQVEVDYRININDPDVRIGILNIEEAVTGLIPVFQAGTLYRKLNGTGMWASNFSKAANVSFSHQKIGKKVRLSYTDRYEGITLRKNFDLEIHGKTLVFHIYAVNPRTGPNGNYRGWTFDRASNPVNPVPLPLTIPYINENHLAVVSTGPANGRFYYSTQIDPVRSHANTGPNTISQGWVPWNPPGFSHGAFAVTNPMRSASSYQPLNETAYLTVTEDLFDVFPGIHRPISPHRPDLDRRVNLDLWTLARSPGILPGNRYVDKNHALLDWIRAWRLEDLWITWCQWPRAQHPTANCKGVGPQVMPLNANPWYGSKAENQAMVSRAVGEGHLVNLYLNFYDIFVNSPYYSPDKVRIGPDGMPAGYTGGYIDPSCPPVTVPGTPGPAPQPLALNLDDAITLGQVEIAEVAAAFPEAGAFLDVTPKTVLNLVVNYDPQNATHRSYKQGMQLIFDFLDMVRGRMNGPIYGEGRQSKNDISSYITPGKVEGFEGGIVGREFREVVPDYDLRVVRPHCVRYGMGYLQRWIGDSWPITFGDEFLDTFPWDKWRATSLAYARGGFISDMAFLSNQGYQGNGLTYQEGVFRYMVKEYYTFRAIQEQYLGNPVQEILYLDPNGNWDDLPGIIEQLSAAGSSDLEQAVYDYFYHARLKITWQGGLELLVNRDQSRTWRIRVQGQDRFLPPNGWYAWNPSQNFVQANELVNASGNPSSSGHPVEYVRSTEYRMVDGRGVTTDFGQDFVGNPLITAELKIVRPDGWEMGVAPDSLPQVVPPKLTSLNPSTVAPAQGGWIVLQGDHLLPDCEVRIEGIPFPAQWTVHQDSRTMGMYLPPFFPQGTFHISVFSPEIDLGSNTLELTNGLRTELRLTSSSYRASQGDTLIFQVTGGMPGMPVHLALLSVNGNPFPIPFASGVFDAGGDFQVQRTITVPVNPSSLLIQAFSQDEGGKTIRSNQIPMQLK